MKVDDSGVVELPMARQVREGKAMRAAQLKRRRPYRAWHEEIEPRYIPNRPIWSKRVYAISLDLDTETLKARYHNDSWNNGYQDIYRVLEKHGFVRQQGSVYFGDDKMDPVRVVLAVQDVVRECPWFRAAVRDIRMLRIEENNDLMPAEGDHELPLGPPAEAAE